MCLIIRMSNKSARLILRNIGKVMKRLKESGLTRENNLRMHMKRIM